MATTTNYGWTTPDDTALVKDGAAAIRTLGSSVDTTTKALNPSTTLGDIEYRSSTANTNTRLGIGTTGQVLSVSGGVPAWQTFSGGGKVLQVVQATTTTEASTTSATWTDSNLSASITPSLSTSKVLVLTTQNINLSQSDDTGIMSGGIRLLRGATTIFQPYEGSGISFYESDFFRGIVSMHYLDSPATTSSTTYKTQIYLAITGGGASIAAQPASCQSSIILMEIGA